MSYIPSRDLLEKYADLLVNFALNSGSGLKKGEVVYIAVPESAKPIYVPLRNAVLAAGGHPLLDLLPEDVDTPGFFNLSTEAQRRFFPAAYYRGLVDQCDHTIRILAEFDKHELEGVDPAKLMQRSAAMQPYLQWRQEKEVAGKFTWTLALYGTPAMAKEVGMSEQEYWEQIISACYLDTPDPKVVWREVTAKITHIQGQLNKLPISRLHVVGEHSDLWVGLGPHRQWMGGSGRNIPSFELFISPDWRQTEGHIAFNQPLYYYGTLIEGIELVFKKGRVTEMRATKNENVLRKMIEVENADKIGEYSLTDGRFSHITRLMGETLYDENMGGAEGNTHLALGNAYRDSYGKGADRLSEAEWRHLGYNESAIHTDIISTERREVTAYLEDGTTQVIYRNGQFTV